MAESRFKDLQKDYGNQTANLAKLISKLPNTRAQERQELVEKGDNLVRAVKGIIREMDLELRADAGIQGKYRNAVDRMKAELDQQTRDFETSKSSASQEPSGPGSARNKLLEAHAVHDEIKDTTRNIQRDLEETEYIGVNVNARLLQQREQIEGTQKGLDDTEDSLIRSKKILTRMGRRVLTDRCIQMLLILVELGIIAIIVWAKWLRKK